MNEQGSAADIEARRRAETGGKGVLTILIPDPSSFSGSTFIANEHNCRSRRRAEHARVRGNTSVIVNDNKADKHDSSGYDDCQRTLVSTLPPT